MRMEIDVCIKPRDGIMRELSVLKGSTFRVRKAILQPNGKLHSVQYLSFLTGEWMDMEPDAGPAETMLN